METSASKFEDSEYYAQFNEAVIRSYRRFNINKPKIKHKRPLLAVNIPEYLHHHLISRDLPPLSISAGQCIKWCFAVESAIESAYGMKAWITLGKLWYGTTKAFDPTLNQIECWMQHGICVDDAKPSGLKVHAWITLENGMIVDPTLPSSLAAHSVEGWHDKLGCVLIVDPCSSDSYPMRYFPMLVGNKIVKSIAKKSALPLLANSPAEMYPTGVLVLEPID